MKKIITLILALALTLSMSTAAFAAELLSFRDIPSTHWAYNDIMRSVELGLVQGTKAPDKNGVGAFNPDGMMTVAQFITVVVRAVEPGQEFDNGDSTLWYAGAWNEAVNLGILGKNDFGGLNGEMASKAITREEMAYVITNALDYMDEKPDQIVDVSRVPDLGKVSAAYRNEVLNVYSLGIICGVDNAGTFNPGGVLTRAQASAVMNRILDKGSRKQVEFGKVETGRQDGGYTGSYITGQTAGVQTFKEGEPHAVPKPGDIVIKADGTKVTIQSFDCKGRTIMGVGQGINIWKGVTGKTGKQIANAAWGTDASPLQYNPATGEVHSMDEWTSIKSVYGKPGVKGTYDGQVDGIWKWTAEGQGWYCELIDIDILGW